MDAAATPHVAFSVCEQYKQHGKGDYGEDDEQDDCDPEMGSDTGQQQPVCRAKKRRRRQLLKKCKKKTKKKVVVERKARSGCKPVPDAIHGKCLAYQPGTYNETRKSFLDEWKKKSKETGLKPTHAAAVEAWDTSLKRALMLCDLSVGELKKRRFIPKGCSTNPFKIRVEESMKH